MVHCIHYSGALTRIATQWVRDSSRIFQESLILYCLKARKLALLHETETPGWVLAATPTSTLAVYHPKARFYNLKTQKLSAYILAPLLQSAKTRGVRVLVDFHEGGDLKFHALPCNLPTSLLRRGNFRYNIFRHQNDRLVDAAVI